MIQSGKLCPICEEGHLTLKSELVIRSQGNYSANVELNYAECSSCGSETLCEGQDLENIFNIEQFYYNANAVDNPSY